MTHDELKPILSELIIVVREAIADAIKESEAKSAAALALAIKDLRADFVASVAALETKNAMALAIALKDLEIASLRAMAAPRGEPVPLRAIPGSGGR